MTWTRVFKLKGIDRYEWALPVDSSGFELLRNLYGAPMGAAWKPLAMRLLKEDDSGRKRERAALPWYGTEVLILRQEAVEKLRPLLLEAGEILPLACEEAELSLWNVTNVVDSLDYDRSEFWRSPSSGGIMRITKHVFRAHMLGPQPAFKLPGLLPIYLGSRFVDEVVASGLTGMAFKQVWAAN